MQAQAPRIMPFDLTNQFHAATASPGPEAIMAKHTLARMNAAAEVVAGPQVAKQSQLEFDALLQGSLVYKRLEEQLAQQQQQLQQMQADVQALKQILVL